MKTSITLFAIAALMSLATFCNATVRYLNNQEPRPNGPGTMHYTDWTSVHTAANPGDTIYVEGSPVSYGVGVGYTITKQLTIIGPGFNTTTYNGYEATFQDFTVATAAAGTAFIGINLTGVVYYQNGSNNITVRRCKLLVVADASSGVSISNLLVEECFLIGWNWTGNAVTVLKNYGTGNNITNLTFRNNLCNGGINDFNGGSSATSIISNNVFVLKTAGEWTFSNVMNTSFVNNIILSNNSTSLFNSTQTNNWYANNISYPSTQAFPSGGTNYPNTNPVLVNQPTAPATINFTPQDYHLTAGSPAVAKGADGVINTSDDIGIYGGVKNYTMTGDPAIPIITQFSITNPTVNLGDNLNLNMTIVRNQ